MIKPVASRARYRTRRLLRTRYCTGLIFHASDAGTGHTARLCPIAPITREPDRDVSSFTFAKGNATKLLSAPLYALGALASAVVPRRKNLWIFGCGSGVGEGALSLYRLAGNADPDLTLVWLAGSRRELHDAHAAGLHAVLRSSWRGFRLTLRAHVIVITHGFGDVNRFGTRGGFVVQLWHGIPLKRIQLDSPVTFRSRFVPGALLRALYRRQSAGISLLPAASEVSAQRLRTAFSLPSDRVVVTGDPRDDSVLGDRGEARARLADILGTPLDSHTPVELYAPTWRDGEPDPCIPNAQEWAAIAEHLEGTGGLFLLRPHPHSVGAYDAGPALSPRIRMLTSQVAQDLNPLLPAIDLVITDFSSVAYDFALTGRPIAFLAPDVTHYVSTRGLYEKYGDFTGRTEVATWQGLLDLLSDEAAVSRLAQHASGLADRHHRYCDGNNTSRVFAIILSRVEEVR
ncbi:MAG: CDP-glycerol glycerophosphotransferase family protein [Terrimesophilobacter sp.]